MARYDSMRKADPKKVLKMIREHGAGTPSDLSMEEIGAKFGISGKRVYQIKKAAKERGEL